LSRREFNLRFLAGRYQGGAIPLQAGVELVIGRAPDSGLLLEEELTSRRHARLLWEGGAPAIEDLGSTNGTFVNGERVTRRKLVEGDRILVGGNILKLGVSGRAVPAPATTASMPAPDPQAERTVAEGQPRRGSAMQGRLEEVPLPDLLQLLGTSRKTGLLELQAGDEKGEIHLSGGRVVGCRVEGRDLPPRESFFHVLAWSEGAFALGPPATVLPQAGFEESTEALLLDGMRLLDEGRRK